MTHVFISYKREDELRVARLARALASALTNDRVEVWWDRGLPAGESWYQNIDEKLRSAACCIVVWTHGSTAPEGSYVRDEARRALVANRLIPIFFDRVDPPLGFGELQAIDLVGWAGSTNDPSFADLLATVRAKLEGRPAPKPGAANLRLARRVLASGASALALGVLGALSLNAFGAAGALCRAPGAQPGLADLCGSLGVGGLPSREVRLAWEARRKGDCAALRTIVAMPHAGDLARRATELIEARRQGEAESWQTVTRSLVLFEGHDALPAGSLRLAQADALSAARDEAERLCRGFSAVGVGRYRSSAPRADKWDCEHMAGGEVCGFTGWADCQIDESQRVQTETCPG